jgi:methionine sulfoxide reductase heme-binding subunit
MSGLLAVAGPSAYWYLTRATGAVTLVLLTISVVLGIFGPLRFTAGPRWPRFAIDSLHRDISLLVIVLLVAHIITSVLDAFAPIKLVDAIIPFTSAYRPLWVGLGALSFDLIIALVITSLARRRLGYGAWRAIHWLAYVSWPVAVLHGVGTGSDTKQSWMLALTGLCVVAVTAAMLARIAQSDSEWRVPAFGLAVIAPLGIALFTLAGPLQHGWASKAGTPKTLLAKTSRSTVTRVSTVRRQGHNRTGATLKVPFSADLRGSAKQSSQAGGAVVDLSLRLSGGAHGRLRVRLAGVPIGGGGLSMSGSQVDLIADGLPSVLAGRVVSLQGQDFIARVRDGSGAKDNLHAVLNIDQGNGHVSGRLAVTQAGG